MRRMLPALAGAVALAVVSPAAARDYPWPPGWWVRDAMCVHGYEGSWTANTGNGYYGGLQMDVGFQRAYGGWFYRHVGTADRWPVKTQLRVAFRGWQDRGWWPWPNTARLCGLL